MIFEMKAESLTTNPLEYLLSIMKFMNNNAFDN